MFGGITFIPIFSIFNVELSMVILYLLCGSYFTCCVLWHMLLRVKYRMTDPALPG